MMQNTATEKKAGWQKRLQEQGRNFGDPQVKNILQCFVESFAVL
jgi:hypothetical protein